jgi:hypothetical protein
LAVFLRKCITIWPVKVLVDVYVLIIFLIFFGHKTLSRIFLVQLLVIHRSGEINSQFLSVLSFDSVVGWSCLIYAAMAVQYKGSLHIILNLS